MTQVEQCVAVKRNTHIVKAPQLLHQSVELEQIQVPVAQNWPFVDGCSFRGEAQVVDMEDIEVMFELQLKA